MLPTNSTLLDQFSEACNYPGTIDPPVVEQALRRYLSALRIDRKIEQLKEGWTLHEHPSLLKHICEIAEKVRPGAARAARDALDARAARAARAARDALDARDARAARDALDALDALDARAARAARAARDALDARDARDALDALDALDARAGERIAFASLQRFASWCLHSRGWYWWGFDLSWLSTTFLGALQLKSATVQAWSGPVFDAFLAGGWLLYWTEDTLYWAAKPDVHKEETAQGGRRLHNASGPALRSDVENLYFWHGVIVPAFVVTKPEWITLKHIGDEDNAEVRRIFIERYGLSRYLLDSGAHKLAEDEFGELYRTEIPGDEPLVMVKVLNSTPEPDGTLKPYFLRVHPELRLLQKDGLGDSQALTPLNAIGSTFGITGKKYLESLVMQT